MRGRCFTYDSKERLVFHSDGTYTLYCNGKLRLAKEIYHYKPEIKTINWGKEVNFEFKVELADNDTLYFWVIESLAPTIELNKSIWKRAK